MPISPRRLLFLSLLIGLLLALIQVNLLAIAFDKLGLSPASGMLLIVGALNLFMRKRGGVSAIWCGILILLFGGIAALLIILYKVSG